VTLRVAEWRGGENQTCFFRTERQSEVMPLGTCLFFAHSTMCCATRAPPSKPKAIADESRASKALDNMCTSELQIFPCIPAARSMANRQQPHLHR
jgi:hypothetical protein